jgi:hypothetical protein
MNNTMTNYLKSVNEIAVKIETIKSAECIMHYDDKTKVINSLLAQVKSLADSINILSTAGIAIKEEDS